MKAEEKHMNLKDFISKAIVEITQGIRDAAKLTGQKVGLYSPEKLISAILNLM